MAKRKTITTRTYLRLLAYGKPGSAKTSFFATAGLDKRTSPVLWLDAGGNPISIARLKELYGREPDLDVLEIEELSDLASVYNWIVSGQPADIYAQEYGLRSGYRTIVIDGITHTQRLAFELTQGSRRILPGMLVPKAEWGHYGSVLRQMLKIASAFYTLPLHVLVTALEHADRRQVDPNDEKTAYTVFEPALAGQSVDEFPGWAYTVGRMAHHSAYDPSAYRQLPEGNNARYIWQIERDRYTDAKDQHNFGAKYIINPTIPKLLDIMRQRYELALAEDREAAQQNAEERGELLTEANDAPAS
jgi:hypothetical protein